MLPILELLSHSTRKIVNDLERRFFIDREDQKMLGTGPQLFHRSDGIFKCRRQ